eukprot:COSAG05_NODE_16085_length_354_cov_0.529412_1_plen_26_part_10
MLCYYMVMWSMDVAQMLPHGELHAVS